MVTQVPADDPRYNTVIETESKVGRTGLSPRVTGEVAGDAQALADNATIRGVGGALETAGKVAVPLAIAGDAVQLEQAYQQDGGTIGVNTGRTAAGVAGGWGGAVAGAEGGAALGASIGSVVPGLGTAAGGVVGGLIGGVAGGVGGDWLGRNAFDTIRSWF